MNDENRNSLIYQILNLKKEGSENWDLYEKYSNSELKKILNDILSVRVKISTDSSVMKSIAIGGFFVFVGIITIWKL